MNVTVMSAGKDPRWSVTFREPGTPWPIRFWFLSVQNGESQEWWNVAFELGDASDVTQDSDPDGTPEIDPASLQRVVDRYTHWLEAARHYLTLEHARGAEVLADVKRQKPARLTDDWLRLVASEFERRSGLGQHAISEIARAHHVAVSTAGRWVKEARSRGFLPSGEVSA
jgi:hypothetical protein